MKYKSKDRAAEYVILYLALLTIELVNLWIIFFKDKDNPIIIISQLITVVVVYKLDKEFL